MRLITSIIVSGAMLLAASVAGAFSIEVSTSTSLGSPLNQMQPGEEITIDVTLRGEGSPVAGMTIGAQYDGGAVGFVSGQSTASAFNTTRFFGLIPQGGISNTIGAASPPIDYGGATGPGFKTLSETSSGLTLLFSGLGPLQPPGTPSPSATEQFDEGWDNSAVSGGTAHFRLVLQVNGASDIEIGPDPGNPAIGSVILNNGAASEDIGTSANQTISVAIIPEPGTALLMGLGLAGLAAAGRRE